MNLVLKILLIFFLSYSSRGFSQEIILGKQRGDTLGYMRLERTIEESNLQDIRYNDQSTFRLNNQFVVYEVTADSIFYTPKIQDKDFKTIVKKQFAFPNREKYFPIQHIISIKDIPQQSVFIGTANYSVEIKAGEKYYYYAVNNNASMLKQIDSISFKLNKIIKVDSLQHEFIGSLASDYYRFSSGDIYATPVNKLLPKHVQKNKYYKKVERLLIDKFAVNEQTNPFDFPLIRIVKKDKISNSWVSPFTKNGPYVLLSELNNGRIISATKDLQLKVGKIWRPKSTVFEDNSRTIFIEVIEKRVK